MARFYPKLSHMHTAILRSQTVRHRWHRHRAWTHTPPRAHSAAGPSPSLACTATAAGSQPGCRHGQPCAPTPAGSEPFALKLASETSLCPRPTVGASRLRVGMRPCPWRPAADGRAAREPPLRELSSAPLVLAATLPTRPDCRSPTPVVYSGGTRGVTDGPSLFTILGTGGERNG